MLPSFLTRPVLRLRPEGGVEAPGPREAAAGPRTVWLARPLCRFERFRTPAGLSRRAAVAAARIHARTRAPFAQAGHALARTDGPDLAVWWWDAAEVGRLLAEAGVDGPVRLLPEAAGQAAGADGWRVLRAEGAEAQFWRSGALEQTVWRRGGFDDRGWSVVARLAPVGAESEPHPPAARPAVFTTRSAYASRFVREIDVRSSLPAAVLVFAVACVGASAVFAGRGLAEARRDAAFRTEIAAWEGAAPRSRRPELAARARGLQALARLTDRPGPLSRLLEAKQLLTRFGLPVTGFDATADELSVSVPATAAAGVDLLVEEFSGRPEFADVRPALDRATRTLTLKMRVVG